MGLQSKPLVYVLFIILGLLLGLLYVNTNLTRRLKLSEQESGQVIHVHHRNDAERKSSSNDDRPNCIIEQKRLILEHHNFQKMVDEKRGGTDAEVIALLKELIDPPSTHMLKRSNNLINTPQAKEAYSVTNSKHNGFFVECGALDGERSSNTIVLENNAGWQGLLVEMDPYFYTQLYAKNRHSWSINACMSTTPFVSYVEYSEDVSGRGQVLSHGLQGESKIHRKVPCFPLESLLLAINKTKVDFFSLDVEGLELEVLKTIPFNKIHITALTVEYLHVVGGSEKLRQFMESQGYVLHKKIDLEVPVQTLYAHDLFFVKKHSR